MTTNAVLQFTSVRTRIVDGKPLIGLKHQAKGADGELLRTEWVEMPPDDAERLIKTLQDVLTALRSLN